MEYRIDCLECNGESIVYVSEEPAFCPLCGTEVDPIKLEEDLDFGDEEYED